MSNKYKWQDKYRKELIQGLVECMDKIDDFYNTVYIPSKERNTTLGLPFCSYYINEDGLYVLENINGDNSLNFENIINLTSLETLDGTTFTLGNFVIDFICGRTLPVKKNLLIFPVDTALKLIDIDFSMLSKFVHKIELPQKVFNLISVDDKDNILDLSRLSKINFIDFLAGNIELNTADLLGLKNQCINSTFNSINLSHVRIFDDTTEPYFVNCNMKEFIISNKGILNARSAICKDCDIEELLIYDSLELNKGKDDYIKYKDMLSKDEFYAFKGCNIKKVTLVSNLLLSNTFKSCSIDNFEMSPTSDIGIELEENAISYSTFNSVQRLNVARLAQSAFVSCVINKNLSNKFSSGFYKPLQLYVKLVPDDNAVADSGLGFEDCYGNFEVLNCTAQNIDANSGMFDNDGKIDDDVIYNTLYAMLYKTGSHYINLPKEFK